MLVALGIVAVVIAVGAYLLRAKPVASGTIENVFAVEQNTHNTSFVAMNVTIHNVTDKTLYIKDIKGEIATPAAALLTMPPMPSITTATSSAYPDLKPVIKKPLMVETKIPPGGTAEGTVLVNFPVTFVGF